MNNKTLRRSRMAMAVAAALVVGPVTSVSALELNFDNPDLNGRLDTTLTAGALFRVQNQDRMLAATGDVVDMTMQGFGSQINKNDGNNNFDRGLASMVYRITPELDVDWRGQAGVFMRASAFYDSMIMDTGHDGGILNASDPFLPPNGFTRYATFSHHANNGIGDGFSRETRQQAGKRARILDAYVWTDVDLFDRPLTLRLGRQVISWGEALFIQGGVNTANYFDLNALRQPGSEIREALLPLGSASFSYGLTLNTSLEGFYQFEWKNSEDAAAGTYFSTHDAFPGRGANNVIIDGRVAALSAGAPGLENAFAGYTMATYGESGTDYEYEQTQVTVNRIRDDKAKDEGQFGLAFRYFAEQLNGTEFAAYYTRTHSRLPVVGARLNNLNQGAGAVGMAQAIDTTEYQMVYNEDVDMFGLSFNTTVMDFSLAGELAYRPKRPIVNEVGDNLIQSLAAAAGMSAIQGQEVTVGDLTSHCVRDRVGGSCLDGATPVEEGQLYYFYDEVESYNASLVSIFNLGPQLGSNGTFALLELGAEHVRGLENEGLRYNSTAAILGSEAEILSSNPGKYYLDKTSWGYRVVVRSDYNNVFAGISVTPSLRFAHDVKGNSPLGGNFMEGRQAATLAFDFVYQNQFEFGVAGTSFWGASYSNKLEDRDFVSASVKYSF